VRCVRAVERHDLAGGLTHEAGKSGLLRGRANRLSERSGRDGDARPNLRRARQKGNHASMVAIQRDQTTRVERDPLMQLDASASVCAGLVGPIGPGSFLSRERAAGLVERKPSIAPQRPRRRAIRPLRA